MRCESTWTVNGRWGLVSVVVVGSLALASPALGTPQQAGVQVALRALGLYDGPIDGQVGPLTRAAIASAQRRAGLTPTGRIGARTSAALGPLGAPAYGSRPIQPGDFGLDVSVLQVMLARDGFYRAALDGYMGPHLEAAVRRFQRRAHLGVDGVAGPATLSAVLRRAPAPPSRPSQLYVVQPGDSLTGIATHFGVGLGTLARVNKLDPLNTLLIGTKLAVPVPARMALGTMPVAEAALDATPSAVRGLLDTWAARLGVSPHLVRALAWMESGYQPGVVSDVGARGVLQTLPETRQWVQLVLLGHPVPETLDGDIEVGILYLRYLLGQFNGDTTLALGAWYQGEAAVKQSGLYEVTKPFVADVLALEQRM
jgi:peptidoglycan hydrolase-like protein with peptidoglycan-binding domain